jgi:hypothetical protein
MVLASLCSSIILSSPRALVEPVSLRLRECVELDDQLDLDDPAEQPECVELSRLGEEAAAAFLSFSTRVSAAVLLLDAIATGIPWTQGGVGADNCSLVGSS